MQLEQSNLITAVTRLPQAEQELIVAEDKLRIKRIQENEKLRETVRERIAGLKREVNWLKFIVDWHKSNEVSEIKNISKCSLEKIAKKDGKATPVDAGNKYVGTLKEDIVQNGFLQLELDNQNGRGLKTVTKKIKHCEDGSYLIETNTSYYRLAFLNQEGQDDSSNSRMKELWDNAKSIDTLPGSAFKEVKMSKIGSVGPNGEVVHSSENKGVFFAGKFVSDLQVGEQPIIGKSDEGRLLNGFIPKEIKIYQNPNTQKTMIWVRTKRSYYAIDFSNLEL
jgi:hypothetical protein